MNCFSLTYFKCDKFSNSQYFINKFHEIRYSVGGRLTIVCLLIIGLVLVLWGIVVFTGLNFISNGILTPNWVIMITLFTQKLGLATCFSILNLAILLVSIGCIIFFTMSLLLPRIQNIPINQRILL